MAASSARQAQLVGLTQRRLRIRTSVIVFFTAVAGIAACAAAIHIAGLDDAGGIALFAVAAGLVERFKTRLYTDGNVTVSFTLLIAAGLALGPGGAAVAAIAVALGGHAFTGKPFERLLFNFGQFTLSAVAASTVFLIPYGGTLEWLQAAALGLLAASAYFAVSTGLVTLVIASSENLSPQRLFREQYAWLYPHHLLGGLMAVALGLGYQAIGVGGFFAFGIPILMSRYAIRQFIERTRESMDELRRSNTLLKAAHQEVSEMSAELKRSYDGTLEALVHALDARDRETKGHSVRVAHRSMEVARLLGVLPETEEWENIRRGALLHDIGKIGVSDSVLLKPGPLLDDEWESMREHPLKGYQILNGVPALQEVADIVHSHHERWDGQGYPRGLAGEDVPLGARIFSVVDAFDAMTNDRPYRAAMPPSEALAEIERNSGTQFDPRVVEAFKTAYQDWYSPETRRAKREGVINGR